MALTPKVAIMEQALKKANYGFHIREKSIECAAFVSATTRNPSRADPSDHLTLEYCYV